MLAFKDERRVVEQAAEMIASSEEIQGTL